MKNNTDIYKETTSGIDNANTEDQLFLIFDRLDKADKEKNKRIKEVQLLIDTKNNEVTELEIELSHINEGPSMIGLRSVKEVIALKIFNLRNENRRINTIDRDLYPVATEYLSQL